MTDFLATGMLPDHYEQLAKTVRDFAQSVVAPVAAKHDEEHSFPYEVVAGMADMGLFGLPFAEEYGGMGSVPSTWRWRSSRSPSATRPYR